MNKVALAQISPFWFDKAKTLKLAIDMVENAAREGAELVVFPEAFISGYPAWIWRLRPGADWNLFDELHENMLGSAVDIDKGDLLPLCEAAKNHQITIVCGMNERSEAAGGATMYNSVVTVDHHGRIQNRHRKLMPTNPERMVWGFGDASGLKVVDTPVGKTGALVCWENYMPLARYGLYAQGIEVYGAPTYDSGDGWIGSMQHIAREGRCWVLSCGMAFKADDLPHDFPERSRLYPEKDEWINPGDSVIVAPGGEIAAGPMHQEKGLLFAAIDTTKAATAKRALDVVGHYARPDIFTLQINTRPQTPVVFN